MFPLRARRQCLPPTSKPRIERVCGKMSSESQYTKSYLDITELVVRTGLSEATIWRLKRAGKIPFYQPAGKNGRVKFPANALELAEQPERSTPQAPAEENQPERLPGPQPTWMSPGQHTSKRE